MSRRNLWKMASAVFVITLGIVLMAGGFVANARDHRSFHYGDRDKGNLFVTADMVRGGTNVPGPSICTQSNRYLLLQTIVFRIKVFDEHNKPLVGTDVDSVWVYLTNGADPIEATYGGHPHGADPPADYFWTAAYEIPSDAATGTFSYEVVAIAGDREGSFQPPNIFPSLLTIVNPTPAD